MRYVDEYRAPEQVMQLVAHLQQRARLLPHTAARPLRIMEVCGGHTHAIFKFGLDQLLPENIEFIHGPGCPVCVLPMGRIDACIEIASRPGSSSAPSATPCACQVKTARCCRRNPAAPMSASFTRRWTPCGWRSKTRSVRWSFSASVSKPPCPPPPSPCVRRGSATSITSTFLPAHHPAADPAQPAGSAGQQYRRLSRPGPRQYGDRHRSLRLYRQRLSSSFSGRWFRTA